MSGWVTQEDRDKMKEAFEPRKSGVVEIEGQNPVEVSFLSPEELEERRKGIEFGERFVRKPGMPYRPNAPYIAPRRNPRSY